MREENQLREGTEDDLDELVALWAHYVRDHRHNPAYNQVARTGVVSLAPLGRGKGADRPVERHSR